MYLLVPIPCITITRSQHNPEILTITRYFMSKLVQKWSRLKNNDYVVQYREDDNHTRKHCVQLNNNFFSSPWPPYTKLQHFQNGGKVLFPPSYFQMLIFPLTTNNKENFLILIHIHIQWSFLVREGMALMNMSGQDRWKGNAKPRERSSWGRRNVSHYHQHAVFLKTTLT